MTARIHRLPAGLPMVVAFSGGREVTYLYHRTTDTYTVWFVVGSMADAELAEGEAWLRSEA